MQNILIFIISSISVSLCSMWFNRVLIWYLTWTKLIYFLNYKHVLHNDWHTWIKIFSETKLPHSHTTQSKQPNLKIPKYQTMNLRSPSPISNDHLAYICIQWPHFQNKMIIKTNKTKTNSLSKEISVQKKECIMHLTICWV